jgi:hypothetical protein
VYVSEQHYYQYQLSLLKCIQHDTQSSTVAVTHYMLLDMGCLIITAPNITAASELGINVMNCHASLRAAVCYLYTIQLVRSSAYIKRIRATSSLQLCRLFSVCALQLQLLCVAMR